MSHDKFDKFSLFCSWLQKLASVIRIRASMRYLSLLSTQVDVAAHPLVQSLSRYLRHPREERKGSISTPDTPRNSGASTYNYRY